MTCYVSRHARGDVVAEGVPRGVGNWSASNVAPPSAADQMRIGAGVRPGIPLIRCRLLIPASLALLGALTAMAAGSSGAAAATAPMPSSGVGSITRVLLGQPNQFTALCATRTGDSSVWVLAAGQRSFASLRTVPWTDTR